MRIQLRKRYSLRMPTLLAWRKAASGRPISRGWLEPPESLARGTLPQGLPRNAGELSISSIFRVWHSPSPMCQALSRRDACFKERTSIPLEVSAGKGDRSRPGRMVEQSYDPIVPMKVENRRAMRSAVAATLSTGGKGGTSRRLE